MLQRFAVKNFRGFSERIEWDLAKSSGYDFNRYAIKDGIIKNGIIYGPNGSGKTSFSLALFDIVNHLTQNMRKADYYTNFVYAGNMQLPVEFEYSFRFDKDIIDYKYSKTAEGRLKDEELLRNGQVVFKKQGDSVIVNNEYFVYNEAIQEKLENSVNNVSIVNFILLSYPLEQGHFLLKLQDFANRMLWFRCLNGNEFIGLENHTTALEEYIIKQDLIEDFSDFLNKVSGQRFDFAKPDTNDKNLFCLINGVKIPFIVIASTGTQSLLLLYYWMQKIDRSSFVFIDEFDAFYHFRLSFEVCKRLFSLQGCQVFTSSHNTYLMTNDLLRPDCNFILNDNKIRPLADCTNKDLSFANIERLYRGGTFKI